MIDIKKEIQIIECKFRVPFWKDPELIRESGVLDILDQVCRDLETLFGLSPIAFMDEGIRNNLNEVIRFLRNRARQVIKNAKEELKKMEENGTLTDDYLEEAMKQAVELNKMMTMDNSQT